MADLFLCDGAACPSAWRKRKWDREHSIAHRGEAADLNLKIENLSHRLLGELDGRSADLVRIAAYAYAADQMSSRGGKSDAYNRGWRRELSLSISVSDLEFWRRAATSQVLAETLNFASEDSWEFHFVSGVPDRGQLPLNMDREELHGHADCVVMFSGGADSLAATLQKVTEEGRRPVLVSHTSTPPVSSRQQLLVGALRESFGSWDFPHIRSWIHRKGSDAAENTQRTRAFLYASLGTTVAAALGVRDVFLADNGVVSLNLPINDQLVGSLATRSTHPKFIWLFNRLAGTIFDNAPLVTNSLWNKTRTECLQILSRHGAGALLQESNSCAYARGRPAVQPHCGLCSQCVDRRFAALAAELEDHDLAERYGLDIFLHPLPPGEPRVLVVSYVRFAMRVADAQEDDLFTLFPPLTDCITADDPGIDRTAKELTAMLKRHAGQVLNVLRGQIERYAPWLASGKLPSTSLIALVAAGFGAAGDGASGPGDSIHSEDFRSFTTMNETYSLTPQQASVVKVLHEARLKGIPEISQASILAKAELAGTTVRDTFKRSKAWNSLIVPGETKGMYRLAL